MNVKVGYAGQKYAVTARDGNSRRFVVGWTNDPTGGGLVAGVHAHPSWDEPQVDSNIDAAGRPRVME